MKLYDFYGDEALSDLRNRMSASLPTGFVVQRSVNKITIEELNRLARGGIDGDLGEIEVLDDGTLAYKGQQRVLVHIKDVSLYHDKFNLPKFHISYCKTLKEQKDKGRYHLRYVFTHNDDGLFHIRLIKSKTNIQPESSPLKVCQFCLSNLNWKGFLELGDRVKKNEIVTQFSLKEFFEAFPKNLITVTPTYNDKTAPLDVYPDNWSEIRQKILTKRVLKCLNSTCGRTSTRGSDFDVHHINGVKRDCSDSNLIVLCVPCHEDEHGHYHGRPTSYNN